MAARAGMCGDGDRAQVSLNGKELEKGGDTLRFRPTAEPARNECYPSNKPSGFTGITTPDPVHFLFYLLLMGIFCSILSL